MCQTCKTNPISGGEINEWEKEEFMTHDALGLWANSGFRLHILPFSSNKHTIRGSATGADDVYIYVENWLDIYVSSSKRTQTYPIQAWNIFFFCFPKANGTFKKEETKKKKPHSHHIHFSLFFRLLQEMKSGSLFVHIKSGPCRRNLFFFIQLNSFYVVMAFSREVFSINTNTFHHFMILSQGSFIAFIIQWTLLSVR